MISAPLLALADAATTLRHSLHVLGAAVWVGGQITLAGLLPTLRGLGDTAPRRVARAFAQLEWPAFALLVATGIWNVAETPANQGAAWTTVLAIKMALVGAAGLAAFGHQRSRAKGAIAALGAITAIASLGVLVLGVVLAG